MGGHNLKEAEYPHGTPVAEDFALEKYKADLQIWVEQQKHRQSLDVENFKAVVQLGQNAIKMLFFMNAGAAGALLTFMGHLSSEAPGRVHTLAMSLTVFVIGMLLAGAAAGTTYASQWFYRYKRENEWGARFNIAAVALGVISIAASAWGIYTTYRVFSWFTQPV